MYTIQNSMFRLNFLERLDQYDQKEFEKNFQTFYRLFWLSFFFFISMYSYLIWNNMDFITYYLYVCIIGHETVHQKMKYIECFFVEFS